MEGDQRIQAILASGIKIPPMPSILLRLNTLLRDPDAGPGELAAMIRDDGALTGAVFRVVGSPVFGLHARINNLPHAIALLGMKNTAALLQSELLRNTLSDPQHALALERLWRRGSAIAERCVAIVKLTGLHDISPDAAYTLGMFHDCGLALLCKRFPAYAEALSASELWPDIPALDRQQQLSHALMGQLVAKNWALPDELVLAIRHHHEREENHELVAAGLSESTARLCTVLNFSIHLFNLQHGLDDTEWSAGWRDETLLQLHADADMLLDWESQLHLEP
jgi:HD-like signal output (HDOD) protein